MRKAAEQAVRDLALPVNVHPHEALLSLLAMRWGEVAFWNRYVADLESMDSLKQFDLSGRFEKASVWYEMRDRALAAAEHVAKTCHDVGIDERRQGLAEEQGRQVAGLLRAVVQHVVDALAEADVDPAVRARIEGVVLPAIIQGELRQLVAAESAA